MSVWPTIFDWFSELTDDLLAIFSRMELDLSASTEDRQGSRTSNSTQNEDDGINENY